MDVSNESTKDLGNLGVHTSAEFSDRGVNATLLVLVTGTVNGTGTGTEFSLAGTEFSLVVPVTASSNTCNAFSLSFEYTPWLSVEPVCSLANA